MSHATDHLDMLLTVGELEHVAILQEHLKGLTPPGMVRPMTDREYQSKVNFAAMNRTLTTAQEQTAAALTGLRDTIVDALVRVIAVSGDEEDAQAALTRFAALQPVEVRNAIADATDQIQAVLDDLYSTGADEVIREAAAQGVAAPDALQAGLDAAPDQFTTEAAAAPTSLWSTLLNVAVKAGGVRAVTGTTVVDLVTGASIAGPYDLARQATNIVHGQGRRDAVQELTPPVSVFASELMDGATCGPCSEIDGFEYVTLDQALTDYPDAGPYVRCDGGDRCRGTLLFVWAEEPAQDPVPS